MNKVTPKDIDNAIFSETYTLLPDGRTIICQLTLFEEDGFTVYGSSACVEKKNFNVEIGNKIAREDAQNKIWPLLGFKLWWELNNLT